MNQNVITFGPDGIGHCLWTEAVPLQELGRLEVHRASMVEFNTTNQQWEVRLISNPEAVAFSDSSREVCLEWERRELNAGH